MPQLVAAAIAKTAVAAPVAATVAPAVVTPAVTTLGTTAANTAALELAKQKAIQAGMQQMGTQAAKQIGTEAAKQATIETSKQGIAQGFKELIPQVADDAAGLASKGASSAYGPASTPIPSYAAPAGPVPPVGPATPLPPAGPPPTTLEQQLAQIQANPRDLSQFPRYEQVATGPGGQTPLVEKAAGSAYGPTSTSVPSYASGPIDPTAATNASKGFYKNLDITNVNKPFTHRGFDPTTGKMFETPSLSPDVAVREPGLTVPESVRNTFGTPEFGASQSNPLLKGAKAGLELVKAHPIETGLGLMAAGQYMNKPKEEDKDKYKNTVDMSGFQPSIAQQRPFTRSYDYQSYAVGGPVEQMSAMNSVGMNTGYPMANLQTPMYSNPAMQRPEAVNVVAPSAGAGVGSYSGEQRFAEGGISAAERREYGLSTRGQRASRNLSKSYEEMEEARQKEAMKLMGERSDPGIVPRSRTQMMSSPFSAAMAEHARLGKKARVPVVEMPKTNLGDIDTYMDIPIEAASGGIMHGLGGYSDGGRLLKGPGDGVSDSIPAVIGKRQPARLADGEFVIPARIVSELGNGSTEAGARKLYAMMERVQNARKKSIGKKKVAVNSKADKHLPA